MSIVSIFLNLLLAGLLMAALGMGWRLNQRLKALRDSHDGFAKAVSELDAAAARAEQGLADLRAATDEATDALADRIEKARALSAKLERQTQGQTQSHGLAASVASMRSSLAADAPPRDRLLREVPGFDADVERVTQRLGSLLSAAREPRPRPEPERVARRDLPPTRQRPQFEDDLFDDADEIELTAPIRAAGGRR